MPESFDAIIIGAGGAGIGLAERLAGAGKAVALIDCHQFDGLDSAELAAGIRALAATAQAAWYVRNAARFGIVSKGSTRIDFNVVSAREEKARDDAIASLNARLKRHKTLEWIRGDARFVTATEIKVGKRVLSAPRIVINTGTTPFIPDWLSMPGLSYLTEASIAKMDTLPDHLVILGAGPAGLEAAQIYARLGSRVTVIDSSARPLVGEDDDVAAAIKAILEAEGVALMLGTTVEAVARAGHGMLVSLKSGDRLASIEGSHLLVAMGRVPTTSTLNLGAAGIGLDERGHVPVDEYRRTFAPGIWALGGVNDRIGSSCSSGSEVEIVADGILEMGSGKVVDQIPVHAVSIDPPYCRIGMTEADVRKSGRKVLIATKANSGPSETARLLKILVDARTRRLLGASILADGAPEAIQMLRRLMASALAPTPAGVNQSAHPTVTESTLALFADLKPLR